MGSSLKHPEAGSWLNNFKQSTLKTGFILSLTRPMLEYLCAVSEDAQWDRGAYGSMKAQPATAVQTEAALTKRGLIERKPTAKLKVAEASAPSFNKLSPAGVRVVEMVKMAGLFHASDSAASRRPAAKKKA